MLTFHTGRSHIHLEEVLTARGADSFTFISSSIASCFHALAVRAVSDRSAILQQRAVKSSPMAAAALGSRLVSVIPGMVLISKTVGPAGESRTSTRL
jgi:hypothetical protein